MSIDVPIAYNPEQQLATYTAASLSGSNYDIAMVVHALLNKDYVCGSVRKRLWYFFDGVKWASCEIGPYKELSRTVFSHYAHVLSDMETHLESLKNADASASASAGDSISSIHTAITQVERDINDVKKIMAKLKNVASKEAIIKECCYLFYDSKFLGRLDSRKTLVCFRNGVYDTVEKMFRPGCKEDMISIYIDMTYDLDTDVLALLPRFERFRQKVVDRRTPNHISNNAT